MNRFAVLFMLWPFACASFNQTYYTEPWSGACASGSKQSPISIWRSAAQLAPDSWASEVAFPIVTELQVENTGHGLQLNWQSSLTGSPNPVLKVHGRSLNALFESGAEGAVRRMQVKPLQLHLHSVSEHSLEGIYHAAEMHIVAAVAKGGAPEWGCDRYWDSGDSRDLVLDRCIAVFAVLYSVGNTTPPIIKAMLDVFPLGSGSKAQLSGHVDITSLIPRNHSYYTYEGSLTTPPCAEGVRWHVFEQAVPMEPAALFRLQQSLATTYNLERAEDRLLFRTNNRALQELNGRPVYAVRGGSDRSTQQVREPMSAVRSVE